VACEPICEGCGQGRDAWGLHKSEDITYKAQIPSSTQVLGHRRGESDEYCLLSLMQSHSPDQHPRKPYFHAFNVSTLS
jgi:hypothetical protein